jgi:tetratricopeptide (TPR) repeat protein
LAVVLSGVLVTWLFVGLVWGALAVFTLLALRVLFLTASDKRSAARFEAARRDFAMAQHLQAEGLPDEAIQRYDGLIDSLSLLQPSGASGKTRPLRAVHFKRAVALGIAGRWPEALESVNQLEELCEGATDLEGQIYLAQTYRLRGFERDAAGAVEEANRQGERLFELFGDAASPSLRAVAAQGLLQVSARLSRLGRYQEALDVNSRLIARYQTETDWEVLSVVANAMGNRGRELGRAGRAHEAIAEFERLISVMSSRREADEIVCRALVDEGAMLSLIGDSGRALRTYQRALDLGLGSDEDGIRVQMARALFGVGNCLHLVRRDLEALEAYDQAIDRYCDLPAAAVDIAKTMTNRASLLLDLCRCDEALVACKEVRERIADAVDEGAHGCLEQIVWIEQHCPRGASGD